MKELVVFQGALNNRSIDFGDAFRDALSEFESVWFPEIQMHGERTEYKLPGDGWESKLVQVVAGGMVSKNDFMKKTFEYFVAGGGAEDVFISIATNASGIAKIGGKGNYDFSLHADRIHYITNSPCIHPNTKIDANVKFKNCKTPIKFAEKLLEEEMKHRGIVDTDAQIVRRIRGEYKKVSSTQDTLMAVAEREVEAIKSKLPDGLDILAGEILDNIVAYCADELMENIQKPNGKGIIHEKMKEFLNACDALYYTEEYKKLGYNGKRQYRNGVNLLKEYIGFIQAKVDNFFEKVGRGEKLKREQPLEAVF